MVCVYVYIYIYLYKENERVERLKNGGMLGE